ncbi:general secretion pathway protein GspB [Thiohalobacter sp.]|uniref:general secretion pathway protein GspB n=1 Tax=Thiohalobacter sp. TaxID=2025948 RepID=UPI00262F3451|nr:general secretion pathway protein GspB [Thiohalobacter sp.]
MNAWLLLLALIGTPSQAAPLGDPTAPSEPLGTAAASGRSGGWTLSATRIRNGDRRAFINGREVREGDAIGNARVRRIRHTEVTLEADGQRFTLRLLPTAIKAKP